MTREELFRYNRMAIFFRGTLNRARWWMQELERRRRCRGFRGWMVKHFGNPERGLACTWNWRVNGVLCTVWIDPMRLMIYEDVGKNTTSYELTERWDNHCAREHVLNLSKGELDKSWRTKI